MTDLLQASLQPGALITLVVVALSIVLFVWGVIPPEVTGLLAAGLLMATGVLKPGEALEGFGSPALITVMALFALSAGLFRSGGLDRLRGLIGSDAVRSPKRMIVLLSAVVAPVSAFVPNTPIVASLLPEPTTEAGALPPTTPCSVSTPSGSWQGGNTRPTPAREGRCAKEIKKEVGNWVGNVL